MPIIFNTFVELAKLLVVYVLFVFNAALANPLFPNEDSTVVFVSEDEFGAIGSIHYRSPDYRYARVRLMHRDGPVVDAVDRTPFEVWIKTDLEGDALVDLQKEIELIIKDSVSRGGIAIDEGNALGQAVGIDQVRSAGVAFDRRIRGELNDAARTAGGGTVISTGPFTQAFEGQYNAQAQISYDSVTGILTFRYHDSRGVARAPRGISAENLTELAKFIDGLAKNDKLSIVDKNILLATEISSEDSPYGNRLKRAADTFCSNF